MARVDENVRNVMRQSLLTLGISTAILTVLGLIMVFSAVTPGAVRSAYAGASNTFRGVYMQIFYALVGVVLAWMVSKLPLGLYRHRAKWIFGLGVALQLAVFTPLGVTVAGNRNWVEFGPVRIQPSEFLKLAMIVMLATALLQIRKKLAGDIREWFVPIGIFLAAVGLVVIGRDMGTALIFALIAAGMFWQAGFPLRFFGWAGASGAVGAAALVAISPSRLARVEDFFQNIFTMPSGGTPSQSDYALWAFGSGGLSGSGLGTGIEKWPGNLAEAQTDFIFAVVGEELGFFGCAVVIIMFVLLGISLIRICLYHPSRFGRLVTGGIALWLCGQAVANMMVVTSLLPVFGVPLPFMSQGGSSIISCLLAVGLAASAALSVDGVRDSFQQRGSLAKRVKAVVRRG